MRVDDLHLANLVKKGVVDIPEAEMKAAGVSDLHALVQEGKGS